MKMLPFDMDVPFLKKSTPYHPLSVEEKHALPVILYLPVTETVNLDGFDELSWNAESSYSSEFQEIVVQEVVGMEAAAERDTEAPFHPDRAFRSSTLSRIRFQAAQDITDVHPDRGRA